MDFASKGKAALADKNARLAVELFTRALIQHPNSPNFYTQRSIAYARLKSEDGGPDHLSSFKNAKIAERLAEQRGSRELLLAAQMRRAIALYHLEYYADALTVLEKIEAWIEKKKSAEKPDETGTSALFVKHESIMMELPIWKMKTEKKLKGLSEEDAKKSASALESQNSNFVPDEKYLKAELEAWLSGKSAAPTAGQSQQTESAASTEASSTTQTDAASKAPTAATETPVEKVRHDWYQTANEVLVTLYAKKVPADKLESDFSENTVSCLSPCINSSIR